MIDDVPGLLAFGMRNFLQNQNDIIFIEEIQQLIQDQVGQKSIYLLQVFGTYMQYLHSIVGFLQ